MVDYDYRVLQFRCRFFVSFVEHCEQTAELVRTSHVTESVECGGAYVLIVRRSECQHLVEGVAYGTLRYYLK